MTLEEQIEFYRNEYETAKTLKMGLVAFGAYMALVKFKEEMDNPTDEKPMDEQIKLAAARAAIRNVIIP